MTIAEQKQFVDEKLKNCTKVNMFPLVYSIKGNVLNP